MILMNFLKNSVTSPVFELEQCSLHINGAGIEKDFNGDQITLLVISIPTKNGQSKKEQTYSCCIYFTFSWQFTYKNWPYSLLAKLLVY